MNNGDSEWRARVSGSFGDMVIAYVFRTVITVLIGYIAIAVSGIIEIKARLPRIEQDVKDIRLEMGKFITRSELEAEIKGVRNDFYRMPKTETRQNR